MGLTFLAAGSCVPEAVSSIIVTNKGYGAMGISNSIGSNTFDILLCLGLPWLIKVLAFPTISGNPWVNFSLFLSVIAKYSDYWDYFYRSPADTFIRLIIIYE